MAITAVATVGNVSPLGKNPIQSTKFRITLDNSYVAAVPGTGGYSSFVATSIKGVSGFEGITVVDIPPALVTDGSNNWIFLRWNRATDKLQAIVASSGIEVANGVDLSAYAAVELTVIFY